MQTLDGSLVHSASDLNAFTECVHLTALERGVAAGLALRPTYEDATAGLLARKGEAHERRHLERLRARFGDALVAFEGRLTPSRAAYESAQRESVAAMERGVPVIYQATFFDGTFLGRADFLQRVERPSRRWPWSYEVVDTKLALSPKPYFLVQLCNYSEHVERIQGTAPECAAIVLGSGIERRFRVADYAAYYRHVKAAYLAGIERGDDAYPFECAHCDLCAWRETCVAKRDADDHLSLVAGIRRDQIKKLEEAGTATLAALAAAADELRPKRLAGETFDNLRAQAAEQQRYRAARAARGAAVHSYTFRPSDDPTRGLARLPQPARGDVFFDMEGDPMYRPDRGLEYLFGMYLADEDAYVPFWATAPAEERRAFEAFVDFIAARRRKYPDLHVYHYAPYEMTALKRLMGGFASRENEIDGFLRAGLFVDLYPVVRQSVWISQPSYSIKKLEALYGFKRATQTKGGEDSIVMFESWLETQDAATLEDIRAYNEDDCRSTFALREWLVRLRGERNASLEAPIPWRAATQTPQAVEPIERDPVEAALLDGIVEPDSLDRLRAWPEARRARWLLGNLMQYHRRDQKPEWWDYFQRLDDRSDLVDGDRKALGGLAYCTDVKPYELRAGDAKLVHTFSYPDQEYDLGSNPVDPATGKGVGKIVQFDDVTRRVRIRLSKGIDARALRALVPGSPIFIKKKSAAMKRIAESYRAGTLAAESPATLDLLLGRQPRLRGGVRGARVQPERVTKQAVSNLVRALDGSYLLVQGPPGAGKTTIGAHTIVDLLAAGKRVALAALSHKALHNLLHKVEEDARSRGETFRACHKSSDTSEGSVFTSRVTPALVADASSLDDYDGCALVSGTTFAWADERLAGKFDVVVIDEAGQISLADALLISLVARDVVLLGDPQQLPQVSQGTHPLGTDRSILEHVLGDDDTISPECGVFLDTSYRMQPSIDDFISNAFYDGRLHADPLNANNAIVVAGVVDGGPRYIPLAHESNQRRSVEEAARIVDEIAQLLSDGRVVHRDRAPRRLTQADILVVTPYNAQRVEITKRLGDRGFGDIGVGTVDKFQGQEASVVFYSLATSSAELAPRGLDFLLSRNRLNVAISRAQGRIVLVCSPLLLGSRATTIEHMRLLNLLCAYVEEATPRASALPGAFTDEAGSARHRLSTAATS